MEHRENNGRIIGSLAGLLPWMIVGLLVLVGVASDRLPFETREHAAQTDVRLDKIGELLEKSAAQVNTLASNQAVMQEALKNLSNQSPQIAELQRVVQEHALHMAQQDLHIEGLEADQKAESSIRAARAARGRR